MSPSIVNESPLLYPLLGILINRIKILSDSEFLLFNSSYEEANNLRRGYSKILSICIDQIHILKNTSRLPDELLAHRIGLIPIGSGKPKEQIDLTGPQLVLSEDLGLMSGTIVVPLIEGQCLKLLLKTGSGTGHEHAKFMPSYRVWHIPQSTTEFKFKIEGNYDSIQEVISDGIKHI